ncbi:hypothetical protein PsYK624_080000 [Phanerochaete sordida]|uniref:Epoxide hydrolase N-terminal domain-containing protein n=1 Tax=Phanerochaete sordida TaxID=48140 RepID=A0A9P3GDK9_9APHY|nr:hypothetical protein PsYK624_080000 [Phanerochaete sordida]
MNRALGSEAAGMARQVTITPTYRADMSGSTGVAGEKLNTPTAMDVELLAENVVHGADVTGGLTRLRPRAAGCPRTRTMTNAGLTPLPVAIPQDALDSVQQKLAHATGPPPPPPESDDPWQYGAHDAALEQILAHWKSGFD